MTVVLAAAMFISHVFYHTKPAFGMSLVRISAQLYFQIYYDVRVWASGGSLTQKQAVDGALYPNLQSA